MKGGRLLRPVLRNCCKVAHTRGQHPARFAPRVCPALRPLGARPWRGARPGRGSGVVVTNFGRTPARVTDAMIKAHVLRKDVPLPPEPDYTPAPGPQEQPKAFLVINDTFQYVRRWKINAKISRPDPTHVLYAVGYVDYTDAFGRRFGPAMPGSTSPSETFGTRSFTRLRRAITAVAISCSSPRRATTMTGPSVMRVADRAVAAP
jgi:hypothetical protein